MSKPIPDGYSYTRCDSYTRDEFLAKYGEEKQADICKKYVEKNPKDCYTTDDEIAIHEMLKERIVISSNCSSPASNCSKSLITVVMFCLILHLFWAEKFQMKVLTFYSYIFRIF